MNKDIWEKLVEAGSEIAKLIGVILIGLGMHGIITSVIYLKLLMDARLIVGSAVSGGIDLTLGIASILIFYSKYVNEYFK